MNIKSADKSLRERLGGFSAICLIIIVIAAVYLAIFSITPPQIFASIFPVLFFVYIVFHFEKNNCK